MTTKFIDTDGRVMDPTIAEEMAYIEKPYRETSVNFFKKLFNLKANEIILWEIAAVAIWKELFAEKENKRLLIIKIAEEKKQEELRKIEKLEQERLEKIEEEKRITKEQEEFELRKKKFEEDMLKREEELKIRNFNAREFLAFSEDYLEKIKSWDLNVLDEIMKWLWVSFLYSDNSLKSINSRYVLLISRIKSLETDIFKYSDILETLNEAKKPVKEKLDEYESQQAFIRRQEEDERKRRAQINHHRRTVACVKRRRRLLLF